MGRLSKRIWLEGFSLKVDNLMQNAINQEPKWRNDLNVVYEELKSWGNLVAGLHFSATTGFQLLFSSVES